MKTRIVKIGAKTIGAVVLVVSMFACGEEIKEEEIVDTIDCGVDSLSYKKDILPIFESNCFSCHSEENYAKKADGNLMVGYSDIKKFLDEGLVIGNIEHKQGFINMPYKKAKIDSCDIEKIKAWAAEGALEN